jgi:branched-chain amino acid transport system substrate-binding protein
MGMISIHRARVRGLVGLALAGLLLATMAACGEEDKPVTKSTATGTPIKIGVVGSLSGKSLPATAGPEGLKAWAATINGKGGLQGHPVEIVVKDDANDPTKSLTAVKQLVEQENVVAITSWTGNDTSWADYIKKKNIPVIGGQSYSPIWQENPVFFPVQSTLGTAMTAQPLMAKNAGLSTIGSYYTADVAAAVEAVKAKDAIAGSLGLEAVFNAAISSSQPDFTAPCLAAKETGVEAMMLSGVPVERITPSCAQQGFTPKWILPGENVTAEVLKTPNLGDVLAPQMAFPFFIDDAATQDYRSAMETDYRGPEEETFSPLTSSAWMAGLVYQAVLDNIGAKESVTSADLFKGLYQVKNLTEGGLLAGLTYTKGEPRSVDCFWETEVHDGEWVAPNGLEPACIK